MDRKNVKKNKKVNKETQQIKEEQGVEQFLKTMRAENGFGLRYSVNYYNRNTPVRVEEKWREDVRNLRRILTEYEKYLDEKEKQKSEILKQ